MPITSEPGSRAPTARPWWRRGDMLGLAFDCWVVGPVPGVALTAGERPRFDQQPPTFGEPLDLDPR